MKKPPRLTDGVPPEENHAAIQLAEGRRMLALEAGEEAVLHEGARSELHRLKAQAVQTLALAMTNTATCPGCRRSGLAVDKTAVDAAKIVLGSTGLPQAKEVVHTKQESIVTEGDLVKAAAGALISLDADTLGWVVAKLLLERPDARPALERALEGKLLLTAEASA